MAIAILSRHLCYRIYLEGKIVKFSVRLGKDRLIYLSLLTLFYRYIFKEASSRYDVAFSVEQK